MFSKYARLSRYNLISTCLSVFLCFLMSSIAIADWNSGVTIEDISTRIAIDIVDEGVQVSIDLKEDALTQLNSNQAKTNLSAINLDQFALKIISIKAGQALKPVIKIATPAQIKKSATVTVFYPFDKPQPQQVNITPDFKAISTASDKYMITVSHQGLPVIDHGVLTSAESLQLNWQDPWYSHFTNPKLQRSHTDPLMAFLYIEAQQVKSEVVVRIKEMAHWTDLGLRDESMIFPDEFAAIKQKVAQFLLAKNKVSIDSNTMPTPILDRVDYIRMGASDIQAYEPQQAQKQVATLIGVSIIHPAAAIPNKIQWHWELFNKNIQRVAIRAYDPAGLFDSYVTPTYPVFEWENMLADIDLPALDNKPKVMAVKVDNTQSTAQYYAWLSIIGFLLFFIISYKFTPTHIRKYSHLTLLVLAFGIIYGLIKTDKLSLKSVQLTEQQAQPILNQLLWNVYQAFEATDEAATYDQLAYSIDGNLIETLYLQNRESFLAQDGGWAKTASIEIQNITLVSTDSDKYLFDCEWLVSGEVIHWGHQHRRDNVYHANLQISPIEGNWKIIALESIGQQRVD